MLSKFFLVLIIVFYINTYCTEYQVSDLTTVPFSMLLTGKKYKICEEKTCCSCLDGVCRRLRSCFCKDRTSDPRLVSCKKISDSNGPDGSPDQLGITGEQFGTVDNPGNDKSGRSSQDGYCLYVVYNGDAKLI